MEKLGKTLQVYLTQRNQKFSLQTVCQIGYRLLEILEKLHSIGKIYNDLKMDNIIVSEEKKDG